MPPKYTSTGVQYSCFFLSAKTFLLLGSVYLNQYQELPVHWGIMLASRQANFPHLGHLGFTQSKISARGGSHVPVGSYFSTFGSLTGKSFSGTVTMPSSSQ